jgi:hypothetical protein
MNGSLAGRAAITPILPSAVAGFASIGSLASLFRWNLIERRRGFDRSDRTNVLLAALTTSAVVTPTAILLGLAFLDEMLQLRRNFQSLSHDSFSLDDLK